MLWTKILNELKWEKRNFTTTIYAFNRTNSGAILKNITFLFKEIEYLLLFTNRTNRYAAEQIGINNSTK